MVAVAALTVPELSVGAGEIANERIVQSRVSRGKPNLQAPPTATPLRVDAAKREVIPPIVKDAAPLVRPAMAAIAAVPPSAATASLEAVTGAPVAAEPPIVAAPAPDAAPLAAAVPALATFSPGTGAMPAIPDEALPGAAAGGASPAAPNTPAIASLPVDVATGFAAPSAAIPLPAGPPDLSPSPPLVAELVVAPSAMPVASAAAAAAAAAPAAAAPQPALPQMAAARAPAAAPSLPVEERAKAAPVPPRPAVPQAAAAPQGAPPAAVTGPVAQPVPAASPMLPPRSAVPALAGIPRSALRTTPPGAATGALAKLEVTAQLIARVDGRNAGRLDFRQTGEGLSVRLGSLATIVGDRLDPAVLARIHGSSSANVYLSLAQLQAQGIPISYDPVYDEFNVGNGDTRPKAARKVHMDQISAPERGLNATGMAQVRR